MRNALIIGGGVAGCSCAYFLRKKGYGVTLLEKGSCLGGMAATHDFHGHLFEFGPHVWFWPKPELNEILKELTNGQLYDVDRKLYSFTADGLYRYPIHMSDVQQMPDKEKVLAELKLNRDENLKLIPEKMPKLGECSFAQYFQAAIGPTLYDRFMRDYTAKMWGIPGSELSTKMVWADRIKDAYTGAPYDPIKFEEHSLGQGQPNWYPVGGWNQVWAKMTEGCTVELSMSVSTSLKWGLSKIFMAYRKDARISWYLKDYDWIIWTLHSDELFDERKLPGSGRIIVPIWSPSKNDLDCESIHFPDVTPVTRLTNMDRITRCTLPTQGSLLLAEIPYLAAELPRTVDSRYTRDRCYNHQTDAAKAKHAEYVEAAKKLIPNLLFCGRHANFSYWGMPETVNAAKELCEGL